MRRLAFFVAVCLLVLAACAEGEETAGNGGTSGPVHITFWHSETASAEENLAALVDRFNASQDEVKVKAIFQGNDADLAVKVIASMGGGDVPTVAYMSEPFTQRMIDSHAVVPIQEYVDRDDYDLSDFAPASLAYYTVDDILYAVPHGLAVPLMFYNKLPFREAGLDPDQPPTDLDEGRAVSERLVQRDPAGNVTRFGFALEIHPWYVELLLAGANELYVNNDNGRQGIATEVAFDGDAGRKVFRWWHDMVDEGLALNVGRSPTGADTLLAIAAKKAVMALSTSAAMRSVVDVIGEGIEGIELGVAPVPGIPGAVPEGSPGVYSRSLWIMSERPQAERDGGWKFIEWLIEPEQQAEWFAGSGYLPVRNSAYDYPAAKDIVARYPEFKLPADLFTKTATTAAALGPLVGPFPEVREAVASAMESMLAGRASSDEAIEAAAEEGNAAISEYSRRLGD